MDNTRDEEAPTQISLPTTTPMIVIDILIDHDEMVPARRSKLFYVNELVIRKITRP